MAIYDNGLNPALPGYKGNQPAQTAPTASASPAPFYRNEGNPTVYRSSDNYAFTSEKDFLSKGGDWNQIQVRPTVPVNVNASARTTSGIFSGPPKTKNDIDSLLMENRKIQQQFMQKFMAPDAGITAAQKSYNDLLGQQDNLSLQNANIGLSAQAGINKVANKPIAMEFITGQQAAIQRQANDQLRANSYQQQALGVNLNAAARNLQSLQSQRQQTLDAYRMALDFGRDDISLAMQMQAASRKESDAAVDFALQNNVTMPFYTIDGTTIYRTSDGKPYSTLEEWQADGGKPELVQRVTAVDEQMDKLLTPSEAAKLGVPYGTTRGEAAGITVRASGSRAGKAPKGPDDKMITQVTANKYRMPSTVSRTDFNLVRDYILANKDAEGEWYDVWGELADELKKNGYEPSDYDGLFWEFLHPDGLKGFTGGVRDL